jgi:hypothetical protein
MQADGDVHATLSSMLPCIWAGLGVRTIVRFPPCQRSARVANTPERFREWPTAMHAEADGHATSSRLLDEAPRGFGARWTLQLAPSHRSASVTLTPDLLTLLPTAVHDEAAEQDTEKTWPFGPTGFAPGTIDQPPDEPGAADAPPPVRTLPPSGLIVELASPPNRGSRRENALRPLGPGSFAQPGTAASAASTATPTSNSTKSRLRTSPLLIASPRSRVPTA